MISERVTIKTANWTATLDLDEDGYAVRCDERLTEFHGIDYFGIVLSCTINGWEHEHELINKT